MTSGNIFSGSITPAVVVLTEDSSNLEYSSGSISFNNKNKEKSTAVDKRSSSSVYCRICHEDSSIEELIDPCSCSGTLALIHSSCLEKWLSTSNTEHCEICQHVFFIRRKNKSIIQVIGDNAVEWNLIKINGQSDSCEHEKTMKSISMWSRSKNANGARGMMGDLISLFVLTPLCLAATYLCAIGASAYKSLGFWEGTGLAVLCCTLVGTYGLWFCATVRYHYRSLQEWREKNQDIKLLVKHRTDEEIKNAIPLMNKSKELRMQDENSAPRPMLAFTTPPRRHRFAFWLGASFNETNRDPVFLVHQMTTFV
ncbi:E3 ubiquitin-protein ligase MARCHF3-like isoform X1 [Venturia canescens]|uniref:E3 ubiquitin-protein ligase MARCHF3-like isoform X1 n=1 Tax=Venturia canescens TaxID=32260 RepID=UPI001C9C3B8F|nr:E3 ubiquitin-protein ligase MARCHF3-like isoform X1 [Venturia canescens]